jgi:hypothetical protein
MIASSLSDTAHDTFTRRLHPFNRFIMSGKVVAGREEQSVGQATTRRSDRGDSLRSVRNVSECEFSEIVMTS